MQKYLNTRGTPQEILIYSAIAPEHIKGCIYIEADNPARVQHVNKTTITQSTITLISTLIHSLLFTHTHSLSLILSHSFTLSYSLTLIHSLLFSHTHSLSLSLPFSFLFTLIQ
jgi:hypothetical protein